MKIKFKKVSNVNARESVTNKINFKGNNTFGYWENNIYKVYSFGGHFPIYAFKSGSWYKNIDKYSQSTNKHQSQLKPITENFIEVDTQTLVNLK